MPGELEHGMVLRMVLLIVHAMAAAGLFLHTVVRRAGLRASLAWGMVGLLLGFAGAGAWLITYRSEWSGCYKVQMMVVPVAIEVGVVYLSFRML